MTAKIYSSPMLLILLSATFFLAQYFLPSPQMQKRTDYIAPPLILKNLSAGLNVQMSDSFWLRAVQDIDHCDQPLNAKECKGKSWLFNVIDLTTELDRKFMESYFFGALALTVIISDYEGASRIFDKGVEEFPKNWNILYAAGYHALYEEKDKRKASKLYFAAAENGAPDWVHVLAGRLAVDGGEKEFAAQILEQMIKTSQDPKLIERLKTKLSTVTR